MLLELAGLDAHCMQAIDEQGPHFPWNAPDLERRRACVAKFAPERLPQAERELEEFQSQAAVPLSAGLLAGSTSPEVIQQPRGDDPSGPVPEGSAP